MSYQKRYKTQMLQTLADMIDDPSNSKTKIWMTVGFDMPISIVKQQLIFTGNIMTKEMSSYVKQIGLFSALLLLPFFCLIAINSVTANSLYNSWFWEPQVLAIWLIIMPAIALIVTTAAFIYLLSNKKRAFWKNITDVRRNWPLTIVAVLSIGIITLAFGHDSVHCVVGNPVKEFRNWQTTWTCIKQG